MPAATHAVPRHILPVDFYRGDDVVDISKKLLGKVLCTQWPGQPFTAGKIVETEAYNGPADKASHAHGMRYTERTRVMYRAGGVGYIYLIYGMYHLFNVVTGQEGTPQAVLVRALEPLDGQKTMMERRKIGATGRRLTNGPGLLTQALGLHKGHTGISLLHPPVWIEDRGIIVPPKEIVASPRVGVAYAEEDALLPWRFRIKGNAWTSKAK